MLIFHYLLLYGQTEEQLHCLSCETPELILYTLLSKIDVAGLKDSIIILFFKQRHKQCVFYLVYHLPM